MKQNRLKSWALWVSVAALVVFCVVKAINSAHKKMEKKKEEEAAEEPAEPSAEEKLLTEIRDLLQTQKKE